MIGYVKKFVKDVAEFYAKNGRGHLPWRKTRDPYKILVSEVMLQQTQVERVLVKYKEFIDLFPTAQDLARATLPQVLSAWQGLGYNRRGKFLHEAGKIIARDGFQKDSQAQKLPGVGPYTQAAVSTFAFNKPEVFIETNIRTVFTHHFFTPRSQPEKGRDERDPNSLFQDGSARVSDNELLPLIEQALAEAHKQKIESRDWYAALMDYGSYLKRSGVRINSASKHYSKQSKFEGSNRQLRAGILRELLKKPLTFTEILKLTKRTKEETERELSNLQKEGLVVKQKTRYSVAG
ncbi:MAG: endonuclease [Candidatus Adlerbacteria bacterium]|nr:endonuclease [Candidatus Adlerbacteria bacterium]